MLRRTEDENSLRLVVPPSNSFFNLVVYGQLKFSLDRSLSQLFISYTCPGPFRKTGSKVLQAASFDDIFFGESKASPRETYPPTAAANVSLQIDFHT